MSEVSRRWWTEEQLEDAARALYGQWQPRAQSGNPLPWESARGDCLPKARAVLETVPSRVDPDRLLDAVDQWLCNRWYTGIALELRRDRASVLSSAGVEDNKHA